MTYLRKGLNSGQILQSELNKYTYLFECTVSKDGKMIKVEILNSDKNDINEHYFIHYLANMPQCLFWKMYTGIDKEEFTTFKLPLKF